MEAERDEDYSWVILMDERDIKISYLYRLDNKH